jgi:hypothetical protein
MHSREDHHHTRIKNKRYEEVSWPSQEQARTITPQPEVFELFVPPLSTWEVNIEQDGSAQHVCWGCLLLLWN